MSPEKQREAIARACGWEFIPEWSGRDNVPRPVWKDPTGIARYPSNPRRALASELPDYLSDLNAMQEAEGTFSPEQLYEYVGKLWDMAWRLDQPIDEFSTCATSAQRAEAFLRTLGLWEEQPWPG